VLAVALAALASSQSAAAATWCGTGAEATDRADAIGALTWHVVYAFPADGTDRFGSLASAIVTDLEAMGAWWVGQDPTRQPRFDLASFPGCSGIGALDLSRAQLPGPGSAYAPLSGRIEALTGALNAPPFAFLSPDKKYLVYYDGPVEETNVCGQGNAGQIDGGRDAFAVVFIAACGQVVGTGSGVAAITATHELSHALNALPFPFPTPGPPNVCPGDQGHPCDSTADLLYPSGSASDTLQTRVLDAGRDDYYGHAGTWWDTQDSLFLERVGGDVTAPTGPASLTPTSRGRTVMLSWGRASDAGGVRYRVYEDGELLGDTGGTRTSFNRRVGETLTLGVRAVDPAGNLGPLVDELFKVGVGIVDAAGRLVRDTVAPGPVRRLRGTLGPSGLTLRWGRVSDAGGLRGYVVERNGRRYRQVVGTTISIPLRVARANWSVRAVDRAGNVGPRAGVLPVR
jgi:hypothetical protein